MASTAALPMNQGGGMNTYPFWDSHNQQQQCPHPSSTLPHASSSGSFYPVQYHNPTDSDPNFAPASRVSYDPLDSENYRQAGYYTVHMNSPASYETEHYPGIHDPYQHEFHHEGMVSRFHRMSTEAPPYSGSQYGQIVHPSAPYGQAAHPNPLYSGRSVNPISQYEQERHPSSPSGSVLPRLSGYDGSIDLYQDRSRYPHYNQQEGLTRQFGGMSIMGAESHAHREPQGSHSLPHHYHDMIYADNSQTVQQQEQSLDSSRQSRASSDEAKTREENLNFDQTQINLFHKEWSQRAIDPTKLTPNALADEFFSIQATLHLRRCIRNILTTFVEPQMSSPEAVSAFRQRMKLLWFKYSTIRDKHGFSKGRSDDWSVESRFFREHDARSAIRAVNWVESKMGGRLSKKDTVACAFISQLILAGQDLARLGDNAIDRRVRPFLCNIPLPSGFQTREELLDSLVDYIREIRPNFADRLHRRQTRICQRLDERAYKESMKEDS